MAPGGVAQPTGQDVFRLDSFPRDGSAQWLAAKDLALSAAILRCLPEARRVAVEIGVWKGAWSLGLLQNVAGSVVVGVDPYPGIAGPEARAILGARVGAAGLGGRFHLVRQLADVAAHLGAREPVLIHVDGDHTEAGAGTDLDWAGKQLAPDGVIAVDDYVNCWYPGIASAMHALLREANFRIVLVTENKAYLCRASAHSYWYSTLEGMLAHQARVPWSHHNDAEPGYVQVPDVLGCPVLLAIGRAAVSPDDDRAGLRFLRSTAREFLPPILHRRIGQFARALGRPRWSAAR